MSLIEKTAIFSYEELLQIGSAVHSAKIKKGNLHEDYVAEHLEKKGDVVKRKVIIALSDRPESYSQPTYELDIWAENTDEIKLIDPKGPSWNNNTPMSDTLMKYLLAKKEVEKNTQKRVRFILLKNMEEGYDYERHKKKAAPYGIEILRSNKFLSDLSNEEINVDQYLAQKTHNLIKENLQKI